MAGFEAGSDERVAVPAIETASSVACVRALGRRGVGTVVVSEHDAPPAAASRYCEETVGVPDPRVDLQGYADALLALARRPDVATIVPLREADVYVLAKHRETFREDVATPWPTLETLRVAQDREALFDTARAAGVAAPETRLLSDWEAWNRPTIVKDRYTHPAHYATDGEEPTERASGTTYLPAGAEPDPATVVERRGHEPIVQSYVPTTDEYGFFALYDRGEAVATFQHRQLRAWKYAGGPSAYRESVDIPALGAAGERLLDAMEYHGLAMVEFLRHPRTGEFLLMEVNPRFWSSLPFTIQAGVDFPSLYWAMATGRPVSQPDYRVGIGGHLLRGEALYLHSLLTEDTSLVERPSFPGELAAVLRSIVRHPRFDYLDGDDPMPFVRDALNLAADYLAGSGEPEAAPEVADRDEGQVDALRSRVAQ